MKIEQEQQMKHDDDTTDGKFLRMTAGPWHQQLRLQTNDTEMPFNAVQSSAGALWPVNL